MALRRSMASLGQIESKEHFCNTKVDSGKKVPGVRFRHVVRDCGMFLDSHSTRSLVMLQQEWV